jgi:precorrin-6B methylase 2
MTDDVFSFLQTLPIPTKEVQEVRKSEHQEVSVVDVNTGFNLSGSVVGQTGVRAMRVPPLYQSAIRLIDGEPDPIQPPIFRYIRALDLIRWYRPNSNNVLYLGLGSGVASSRIASFAPAMDIQGVEIDEQMIELAVKWFDLDTERIQTHIASAQDWLSSTDEKFDVIVVDIFLSGTSQIHSQEFLNLVLSHLKSDGLVATNLIGALEGPKSALVKTIIKTYKDLFSNVHTYPINFNNEEIDLTNPTMNVELFASNSTLTEDFGSTQTLGGVTTDSDLNRIIRDRYKDDETRTFH